MESLCSLGPGNLPSTSIRFIFQSFQKPLLYDKKIPFFIAVVNNGNSNNNKNSNNDDNDDDNNNYGINDNNDNNNNSRS